MNWNKCQNSYTTSERFWLQYSTAGCYHFSLVAPSAAVCFNTPQWSLFFLLSSLFSGLFNNMSSGPSKSWFSFFSITNTNGSKSFRKSHFQRNVIIGIPRFTLLMWKHNCGSKNRVNRGYLLVLKGRKIG